MNRKTIRLIVVLATVSIIGITSTQVYWVKRAFDIHENEFNFNVTTALKRVAQRLCDCENLAGAQDPIEQMSSNYFTVMVNDMINPTMLDLYLREELNRRNVQSDFEYGIYDCSSEDMIYTRYVEFDGKADPEMAAAATFPELQRDDYYFGVYFPGKDSQVLAEMGIWIFSSFATLVVIIFFGYTLFVILKQKRLSEIQTDFINNMTHEFKTPISTISISSEVLKDPSIINTPERLLNYATIIQNESNRLSNQVERVLQMATLEKEDLGLKKETVDLHELVSRAIEAVKISLKERKGEISCTLKATKSEIVADKLHLTNIIFNLLDNAIKYCQQSPAINLITTNKANGIELCIADNGIGIASGHQKRIFERFFRVSTGNVHDVKGFGLGLNYVNVITQAHDGEVSVESNLGQGSKFRIYLPFK